MIERTDYPSRVYKYVTPARIDVLQNLAVRFTQPLALNDPFELKPLFAGVVSREKLDGMLGMIDELRGLKLRVIDNDPLLKDKTIELKSALLALRSRIVNWDKTRASHARAKIAEMLSTLGILSFSSSATNLPLWAHYAQGGKGLAYEFNTATTFFSSPHARFKFVTYVDRKPDDCSLTDITEDELYFTKTKQWAYEEEWRLVAPLEQAKTIFTAEEGQIYLFVLPESALSRVIVGPNACSKLSAQIKSIIQSRPELSHIEMAQVNLDLESHCLNIVPLPGRLP